MHIKPIYLLSVLTSAFQRTRYKRVTIWLFYFFFSQTKQVFFKEHIICRRFVPATNAVYINHFIQARQYDNQEVKIIISNY